MERLLLVTRYSGDDETGALERQRARLEVYAQQQAALTGAVMAQGPGGGWVEDETVSGSINLDERRSLGQWLRPPLLDAWDVMVVTEQDRVTRDDLHWWAFVGRLIQWGKRLVVLDDPTLDLSTPNGRMIAGIKATQAANYRLDVKKKIRAARVDFREQRRYVGGWWPYGRRAEPRGDSGEGWEYVVDPVTSEIAKELVDRIIEGGPSNTLRAIANDLNRRGIPTGRDHQIMTKCLKPGEKRQEPKGHKWTESTVTKILRNPSLIGYPTHKGELIRKDGIPVQWWEPIVDVEKWHKVQEILDNNGEFRRGIRANRSDLLGVVFCGCGEPLHFRIIRKRNKNYRYYRCATITGRRGKCSLASRGWTDEFVKAYVEEAFLTELSGDEIVLKRFKPGKNRDPEIRALRDAIDHLSGNLASLPPGGRAAQSVIAKISEYEAQLDELEAEPVVPSTFEEIGTGQTYGERWAEIPDWKERGNWLLRLGIRLVFRGSMSAPEVHILVPKDVKKRAPDALAEGGVDTRLLADAECWVKAVTS